MFTGIVEETGCVVGVETRADIVSVRVRADRVLSDLPQGGSLAVDGCCLTAVARDGGVLTFELTPETMRRTAFGARLRPGARVNLERPLKADGRFDGHIVQGHVDGVGRVVELRRLGESAELLIEAPPELERYLVLKGSVSVDGVSLTVAALEGAVFTIALIPYTLDVTSLGQLGPGDPVNLEADVIAKYVERLLAPHRAA
jgi:riboflavin synthase